MHLWLWLGGAHYLRCDYLWTILTTCARLELKWLDRTPAQRIGFVAPSTSSLAFVVVAFRVYNALKARRDAGSDNPELLGVECEWAIDLANQFFSELPRELRPEN